LYMSAIRSKISIGSSVESEASSIFNSEKGHGHRFISSGSNSGKSNTFPSNVFSLEAR